MSLEHTRFLWNNLFDDATLDASTEAVDFPVENIQNHWPTFAWRSTDDTSEYITINTGAASPIIKALIIKGHNFTAGASVRIQAGASTAYETIDETHSTATATLQFFWTTANHQYWKITITEPASTDHYIKIGRMFLGDYFSPAYDVSSYSVQINDPSEVGLSVGRQSTAALRSHYRTWTYQFAYVKQSDMETFENIFAEVGFAKPYFIVENIYNAATTRYVRNASAFNFNFLFYDESGVGFAYDMDFTLEEEL